MIKKYILTALEKREIITQCAGKNRVAKRAHHNLNYKMIVFTSMFILYACTQLKIQSPFHSILSQ